MTRLDAWLKRLWLVNGFALLVLTVVLGGMAASSAVTGWRYERDVVHVAAPGEATSPDPTPRAVRIGNLVPIRGTTTRLAVVQHGRSQLDPDVLRLAGSMGEYSRFQGPDVNVVFVDPGDEPGRLLLDVPAIVLRVDHPSPRDTTFRERNWIAYWIVTADTNRNGRLDGDDRAELYVSELDGTGLRRVLDDRYHPESFEPIGDGSRIRILALEGPLEMWVESPDRLPQRVLVYDHRTGAVEPDRALNELIERAGAVLTR